LLVAAFSFGCQKAAPKRTKRTHHPPTSGAAAPEGDPPPAAEPSGAAPAAPTAARPAEPLPAPRHQLTVDPNPTPPNPTPPPPRHAARTPAPTPAARVTAASTRPAPDPAPEPAVGYMAVQDKRAGSACPAGGRGDGELLSVHGVAENDTLNVRESPDRAAVVVGELPPDATGVRGTANRKKIGASMWREVECGKLRGWVNERFLAK
jgi:hypothetical protein